MTKEKALPAAEAFVRRVLTQSFRQKADAETVRSVAEKLAQIVADSAPKKATAVAKKTAA
jgi:hypothetical protein